MNNKGKYYLILLVFMLLLIAGTGSIHATNNTDDTKTTDNTIQKVENSPEKIMSTEYEKETTEQNTRKHTANKTIQKKENCRVDTKTTETTVNDFTTLNSALTDSADENITVNINSDIILNDEITLSDTIKHLTIEGNNNTINGNNNHGFLTILHPANITLNNLNIINSNSTEYGGAIYARNNNLTITNGTLTYNTLNYGGAIYGINNSINITNCILTINNIKINDGIITDEDYTSITITNTTLNTTIHEFNELKYILLNPGNFNKLIINLNSNITLEDEITPHNTIKHLTIEGNNHTINGNNTYRFLSIKPGDDIIINNLNLVNCTSGEYSGVINVEKPTLGDTTSIMASFHVEDGTPVPVGQAVFRVNGKTLRDNDGKVIYVNVVDGQAVLSDVELTSEWMKPDTIIQAVYMGNDVIEPIFTEKKVVNIAKRVANVEITSEKMGIAGESVTLSVKVMENDLNVTCGCVVFKLNGKTLKGEKGKILYAPVTDGVATVNYTIPAKTRANTWILTAVFTDSYYERSEAMVEYVIDRTG